MPLIIFILNYFMLYLAAGSAVRRVISLGSLFVTEHEELPTVGSVFDLEKAEQSETQDANTISLSDVELPRFGEQYGEVHLDRLGMTVPLFYGDDLDILDYGVGQSISSSMPGFGYPVLIGGHNNSDFQPLQYAEAGDIIEIVTNYGTFGYEIRNIEVHAENDESAINLTRDHERLILYTCYPFIVTLLPKTERLYIYADKIYGPEVSY